MLYQGWLSCGETCNTFPNKLQQAQYTYVRDVCNDCLEDIDLRLVTILPPPSAPMFQVYTSWTQFAMRNQEINLEHVKNILADSYPYSLKIAL